MRDLLEFASTRDIENVVAAVMQIIAAAADAAQRGIAGDDARERDGFLGRGFYIGHVFLPTIAPRVARKHVYRLANRKRRARQQRPAAKARRQMLVPIIR